MVGDLIDRVKVSDGLADETVSSTSEGNASMNSSFSTIISDWRGKAWD